MAVDLVNLATCGDAGAIASVASELAQATTEDSDFMNQRDALGKSALDIAVMLGKAQIVQELIAHGADIKRVSSNGYSALHHAATWGRLECAKILVEAGASIQQETTFGERARECAARYQQTDCVDFLDRAEARMSLSALVQSFKDTITDPEKHMGRLSKDDRITGNKACDEKTNWMENNKDSVTLDEIKIAINELETILAPIFSKLQDQT